MKIIIDTNVFIYAAESKIDLFAQLKANEIFTTTAVITELKKLSKGRSRKAENAKLALALIEQKGLKILHTKEKPDKSLLEYGKKGYAVATHDRILAKQLKINGCKTIYIRQKKYMEGLQ